MDNTQNFLLSKEQYKAFIAKWKAIHSVKEASRHLEASDFLLYFIFTTDLANLQGRIDRAFSKTKNQNKLANGHRENHGLYWAIRSLVYRTHYRKSDVAPNIDLPFTLDEAQLQSLRNTLISIK